MAKTKTIQVGEKTFEVRVKPSYQIMDWAVLEFQKVEKYEEGDERNAAALELRTKLMQKMVVEPKLTDEYMKEEADSDEWELSLMIMGEVGDSMQERFNELKKKHPSLSELAPTAPEAIGAKRTQ